ncbi:hypothetical protein AOX56_10205 [Aeromonas sobria]|uniref:D-alanine--D-alanine ligase A n=1 Tax=Aeromonas sobria TaxID=646 RepID=A0A2N3J720_AERSO|nr:hypothetical protein AOX56_10205 [Aeromonas sobria]
MQGITNSLGYSEQVLIEKAVKARELKLTHLSRIDFFLTDEGESLLNEINTFPGMTSISMFPKLLEHHGHNFAADPVQGQLSALSRLWDEERSNKNPR